MGEIYAVGLLDDGGHDAAARARHLARQAVHGQVPAEVVSFTGPLRDLSRAGTRGPGSKPLADLVTADALFGAWPGQLGPPLLDEFRWRAWVAQAMGAVFVICPDVPPPLWDPLAAMGVRVVGLDDELPGLAELSGRPGLTFAPAAVIEAERDRLDHQLRLRSLRLRAGEVVTGSYTAGTCEVGSVVAGQDGTRWDGLSLGEAGAPGSACAEAVALSNAIMGGACDLAYVATVVHPRLRPPRAGYRLAAPCGSCRSLLLDAGEAVQAVVEADGVLSTLPLSSVL